MVPPLRVGHPPPASPRCHVREAQFLHFSPWCTWALRAPSWFLWVLCAPPDHSPRPSWWVPWPDTCVGPTLDVEGGVVPRCGNKRRRGTLDWVGWEGPRVSWCPRPLSTAAPDAGAAKMGCPATLKEGCLEPRLMHSCVSAVAPEHCCMRWTGVTSCAKDLPATPPVKNRRWLSLRVSVPELVQSPEGVCVGGGRGAVQGSLV